MNLIYFANARIPTEKAHGFQIMKMCASFAAAGANVTLVVPDRTNTLQQDSYAYYGVAKNFSIVRLATPNILRWGPLGYFVQAAWFSIICVVYSLRHPADVYYSRDESALALVKLFRTTVLEVHSVPSRHLFLYRPLLWGVTSFVSTNQWKAEFLVQRCGVRRAAVLVFPNGVDISDVQSRDDARRALGLRPDIIYVVYTGHLYEWKGAHVLAAAAALLPPSVQVLMVGGYESDIRRLSAQHPRVTFVGQKTQAQAAVYRAAADIVVVPNIPSTQESTFATSPLKLFEYMAARKPIIASDMPSIREIVDETCVVLVPPGDPAALANAVQRLASDPARANALAACAHERVQQYSWERRTRSILDFISRTCSVSREQ